MLLPVIFSVYDKLSTSELGRSFGMAPDYRQKVVDLYERINPEKLTEIDYIMKKYEGKEELLIERLEKKYGRKL